MTVAAPTNAEESTDCGTCAGAACLLYSWLDWTHSKLLMDPTLQYALLMFGSCLGVYQIGAAAGDFRGLWFLPHRMLTGLIGVSMLAATYVWFFTWGDLKMNADANNPEVEGFQQLCIFLACSFVALVITYAISSLANIKPFKREGHPTVGEGLEDLKWRTVLQAFAYRWKKGKS